MKKQTSLRACRAPAGCVPFAWATGGARHAKGTDGSSSTYQTAAMPARMTLSLWLEDAATRRSRRDGTGFELTWDLIGTWINVLDVTL